MIIKNQSETETPSTWDRAKAMTVRDLLDETRPAAAENIPDAAVVSFEALGLCAGRHAKAVVHGLLLASLRILTDCQDDGSFEIPNVAMMSRGSPGPVITSISHAGEVADLAQARTTDDREPWMIDPELDAIEEEEVRKRAQKQK